MKVRLTRKFSDILNGIDLSGVRRGDTLDLPARDAALLVAEEWAEPVAEGEGADRDRAHDRRAPARRRRGAHKKRR